MKKISRIKIQKENAIQVVESNQCELNFNFSPKMKVDGIPMIWFKAAESILLNSGGILNANTVKLLAADAYRQKAIATIKG